MRRTALALGGAAILAGIAIRARRSRGATSASSPGVLPGRVGSWVNAYLDRPLHAAVARALDLRPDDDLLDVACGAGYFLTDSASHARHVAGIDLSPDKVRLARERLAGRIAAGTAEVAQGDAGALPWPDGRFSAVSCMDAFPFFPNPDRALAEMRRVLRPGGRAVVDLNPTILDGTPSHRLRGPGGEFVAWNDTDARAMVEAAGFDDVALTHVRAMDNRLLNSLSRRLFGTDEETIIVAVASEGVRAPEAPTALGA